MKKLAAFLAFAIVIFSALAYWQETRNRAAREAESVLGQRPGGIIINAPAPETGMEPGTVPQPATSSKSQTPESASSGETCP